MTQNEFETSIAFWKASEQREKAMMLHSRKAWKKLEREMKKWEVKYSTK